jgi:hypothetical protein
MRYYKARAGHAGAPPDLAQDAPEGIIGANTPIELLKDPQMGGAITDSSATAVPLVSVAG